jgi:hypothetical protein
MWEEARGGPQRQPSLSTRLGKNPHSPAATGPKDTSSYVPSIRQMPLVNVVERGHASGDLVRSPKFGTCIVELQRRFSQNVKRWTPDLCRRVPIG